jgi:hypothetical protein
MAAQIFRVLEGLEPHTCAARMLDWQVDLPLLAVRAENLVRGPDLQSCLLAGPALMITSRVPAVRLSPDYAGSLLAAAVTA